jgi:hypothetical protein
MNAGGLILLTGLNTPALAVSLADLSAAQASQGLKLALEKGALAAVTLLGQSNGFMGNEAVRIGLPAWLTDAGKLLRSFGQGARLDELIVSMNRAAEAAVPLGKDLLMGAVKSMNVQDAKKILSGGETSVTDFFSEKTRPALGQKFLLVVSKTTAQVGLADKYNQFAAKASGMGLLKGDDSSIEHYVTGKTLDGLYFMIAQEEKKIRQDPVGTGSAVLQKVFGVLR